MYAYVCLLFTWCLFISAYRLDKPNFHKLVYIINSLAM